MKTTCPHCSQNLQIDQETLGALQGASHFECPTCAAAVPVPAVRESKSVAPRQGTHPKAAARVNPHRGLNRNLLILGATALLVLGGLAVFFASRKGGSIINNFQNITNQIVHNSYFTHLIASGVTTARDLEAIAEIKPYGGGFIGISRENLGWEHAQALAKRTGAEILAIEDSAARTRVELMEWLRATFASHLSSTLWVLQDAQSKVLDHRDVLSAAGLETPRKVALQWKSNIRTFDPLEIGPLNPLWTATSEDMIGKVDNSSGGFEYYLGSTPEGNFIFISSKLNSPMTLVSLDADSGKIRWQMPFEDQPEGTQEFLSTEYFTPEGQVVLCSVSYRFDPNDRAVPDFKRARLARIHLRVVDTSTGKLISHMPLTYDNPATTTESKPIIWSAHGNTLVGRVGGRNALVNGYFFAELDPTFNKVQNVIPFPKRVLEPGFFGSGGIANDSQGSRQVWTATIGEKEVRELVPPHPDWKISYVRKREGRWLLADCIPPEAAEKVLCAYDSEKMAWAWTKRDTDPTDAKPGPVTEAGFWSDRKTRDASKRLDTRDTLILDAASGEVRYRISAGAHYKMQSNGKAWIFPQGEIQFVNCATGEIEARFPRAKAMPLALLGGGRDVVGDVVYLPKGRLMIVETVDGALEVSVADASKKAISPPRKIAVDLPGPVTRVFAKLTDSACVLMLDSGQSQKMYCALPLPTK